MSENVEKVASNWDNMKESLSDDTFLHFSWEGRKVDPLLQNLIELTNLNPTHEHMVTLTVGGNLISGILISFDAYMDQWAEEISKHYTSENGAATSVRDDYLAWKAIPEGDPADILPAQFIHLKQAEIYASNRRPIISGGSLWRGKLSSVDGFNLGSIKFE